MARLYSTAKVAKKHVRINSLSLILLYNDENNTYYG